MRFPVEGTFDEQYGLELAIDAVAGRDVVEASVPVREVLLDRLGNVGSGVFASVAESVASLATVVSVIGDGKTAMGLSNDTSVVGRVSSGTLHATARLVARGDDLWLWTVDAADDAGRPCAHSRVTVAVRPMPAGARAPAPAPGTS